jgi:hypothetical protein
VVPLIKFVILVALRTCLLLHRPSYPIEDISTDMLCHYSHSIKFYTEEGNYDMVGNNTPVFFIRDTIKFPDFIHTQKRKYVLPTFSLLNIIIFDAEYDLKEPILGQERISRLVFWGLFFSFLFFPNPLHFAYLLFSHCTALKPTCPTPMPPGTSGP